MEYCRITEETLHWFAPLIPAASQEDLKQKKLYAIGAAENEIACGVLLFRLGDPAAEILYMAVSPAYRRRGCATGMVRWLCRYAEPTVTPVFCSFTAKNKEDPVYLLFAEMPEFTVERQEGISFRLPIEDLESQPLLVPTEKVHPVPFFTLPKTVQREFRARMLEEQDFALALPSDSYLQNLCLCTMEHGQIQSAIFVKKAGGKDVCLEYIWRAPGYTRQLLSILGTAGQMLHGSDGNVYFGAVNAQSQQLAQKLFPQIESIGDFYEAAWDMTGGEYLE